MQEQKLKKVDELTDVVIDVLFGDHGSLGWNADTKNPAVYRLWEKHGKKYGDLKLDPAEVLVSIELFTSKFKAKLIKEVF